MSLIVPSRRRFLGLGAAFLAAPAIVRVASIMPVKPLADLLPSDVLAIEDWNDHRLDALRYVLGAARINHFKSQILRHAVPLEVLGRGDRITPLARRWLPYAPKVQS